jgi:hypothetical protein
MPCPSHPSSLDHSNYTWRRVQVMKLLIMQFSPTAIANIKSVQTAGFSYNCNESLMHEKYKPHFCMAVN